MKGRLATSAIVLCLSHAAGARADEPVPLPPLPAIGTTYRLQISSLAKGQSPQLYESHASVTGIDDEGYFQTSHTTAPDGTIVDTKTHRSRDPFSNVATMTTNVTRPDGTKLQSETVTQATGTETLFPLVPGKHAHYELTLTRTGAGAGAAQSGAESADCDVTGTASFTGAIGTFDVMNVACRRISTVEPPNGGSSMQSETEIQYSYAPSLKLSLHTRINTTFFQMPDHVVRASTITIVDLMAIEVPEAKP